MESFFVEVIELRHSFPKTNLRMNGFHLFIPIRSHHLRIFSVAQTDGEKACPKHIKCWYGCRWISQVTLKNSENGFRYRVRGQCKPSTNFP